MILLIQSNTVLIFRIVFKRMLKSTVTYFFRYQLLSGVTELDRYHDFGVIELEHGVLENQRDDFIKKYAKIIFEGAENEALKAVLKE